MKQNRPETKTFPENAANRYQPHSHRTPLTYPFSVEYLHEVPRRDRVVPAQTVGDALQLFREVDLLLVPAKPPGMSPRSLPRVPP